MKTALTYVQNNKVKQILEWAIWLQKNLEYPNSENSRDERRYTEIFEEKIKQILEK